VSDIDIDALRAWNQATMRMGEITKLCNALDAARAEAKKYRAAAVLEARATARAEAAEAMLDSVKALWELCDQEREAAEARIAAALEVIADWDEWDREPVRRALTGESGPE
jgi:hypothetical protein